MPRDHWLTEDEIACICNFARAHPLEGYRRMTFMMLDADVVACSPSSVYRVLKKTGLLAGQTPNVTKKGTGFVQPLKPHQQWHVDISYLNIAGTFYYLCSLLDGYSRFIVHWEIRDKMAESDVETIIQRAREKFPDARPRIISDNGPQFIAKDFKEFIRIAGMTHVRTSPYYPQSNGKLERFHKTIKGECIRVKVPLSLEDSRRIVTDYVEHYHQVRLHSAIGYVTPNDKLLGNDAAIHAARDRKLAEARERRKQLRQTRHEQLESPSDLSRPALDFAAVRAALQQSGLFEDAIDAGRAASDDVGIEHHEGHTTIAFQRVRAGEVADARDLVLGKPVVARHPGVVLVDLAEARAPVLELAAADADPRHEMGDGDVGFVGPSPDIIDDRVARVVRHPTFVQGSPFLFFSSVE